MAAEGQSALEAQQEVLADGFDRLETPTVEPLRQPLDLGLRVRRLDLDPFADEHLQAPGCAMEGVAFRHAPKGMQPRVRAAIAGAVAATVWSAAEPLDRRVFGSDYSDVAVLGKAFTRGPGWLPLGLILHAANGALFGLAFDEARRRLPLAPRRLAMLMAMTEHVGFYPLGYFVDRYHPARGARGIPPLLTNGRAFAQATFRHALFGYVLGRLA